MAKAPGTTGALSKLSLADLHTELKRRGKKIDKLRKKRASFQARADALDRQIREFESVSGQRGRGRPRGSGRPRGPGRPPGPGAKRGPGRPPGSKNKKSGKGKRPKNTMTLRDALALALKDKTMGPSDAVIAVKSVGYNSGAANFRTMVNQTLLKYPKMFKKTDRGMYTVA